MHLLVWVLGLLIACDGETAPEEVAPAPAELTPQPPPAPVADARALAMSGRHAEAAAHETAEAELAERERGYAAGLSAHQQVTAALHRGDVGAAAAAAAAAPADQQDALAALVVAAGGTVSADVGPLTALARSPRQDPAAAQAVSGWLASIARAELALRRGDVDAAMQEAEAAAGAAPIEGNLWRARAARRWGAPTADAVGWAKAAAEAAIASADGAALLRACGAIVALHSADLQVDQGLSDVRALHEEVLEAHGELGVGMSGIALAQAAMSAGRPLEAQEAAALARAALEGDAAASKAAWLEGWAAYQLGEVDAIEAAQEAASGAHAQALAALAGLAQGLPPSETTPLPTDGLSDRELAYLNVEAALLAPETSSGRLGAAVAAADRTRDAALQVYTRLHAEASARANGSVADARAVRAELLRLFGDAPPPALAAELAVRGLLSGEPLGAVGEAADVLKIWSALASGQDSAAAQAAWSKGLADWARGRAQLAEAPAEAAAAFNAALGGLPVHRQGLLSLGTALDGSQGVGLGRDLQVLEGASDDARLDAALAVHELAHRLREARDDAALGRDMTAGMPSERRRELRAAAARARVEVLLFHLGGPFPDEMLSAIVEAERAAAAEEPFQRTVSTPGMPLSSVREAFTGACVVSYAEIDGRVSGLVIAPAAGQLSDLGPTAELAGMLSQYRDALVASVGATSFADYPLGSALRERLIEPFAPVLTGFGRYLVIAPSGLLNISLATLPEHESGLRYLADIRTISQSSSLRLVQLPDREVTSYSPEFFGVGNPIAPTLIVPDPPEDAIEADGEPEPEPEAAPEPEPAPAAIVPGSDIPADLRSASRHFGQAFRTVLIGGDATKAAFLENIRETRHLFVADLPATSDGGFVLADGELSLSEVRAQPMVAQMVFISAPAAPELQAHRVRAFLEAGARAVVVTNWEIPDRRLNKMVAAFYESLNRDRPPVLALGDARQAMLRDLRTEDPDFLDNPALWGAMMLYGAL